MTPIRYLAGDATSPVGSGPKIIVHCCNDIGVWGAGFVLALSKRWEEPERRYRQWAETLRDQELPLGEVQFVQVERDITVGNLIGQHGTWRERGHPPVRYEALAKGFDAVAEWARSAAASVHMPRLGCGLAGGDWRRVEPLILGALSTFDIPVCVYDFN